MFICWFNTKSPPTINSPSATIILKTKSNTWETESVKGLKSTTPQKISNIVYKEENRLVTSDSEFNRVLGGGIVPGSLTLLGGEPGIGKSTLLLQIAIRLPYSTLYVSGEESQSQIKMRANRMNHESDECYVLTEISLESIFKQIKKIQRYANKVILLRTTCAYCDNLSMYSKLLAKNTLVSENAGENPILVGGSETFSPVCEQCFTN